MDGLHVHVDAILEAQQITEPTDPQERIVKIGLGKDEDNVAKEFAAHAAGAVQELLQKQGFMPMAPKQFSAMVCFYMTKEHFNYLGRPSIDDYIELNARTDWRR